jgi:tetratricopeptide (TPR) repeat protein
MSAVLHEFKSTRSERKMRRIFIFCLVLLASSGAGVQWARAGGQGYPNGQGYPGGGMGGGVGGHGAGGQPVIDTSSAQSTEKPDKAAKKAFQAGLKSLKKAHDYEDAAAKQTNPDKKADLLDKIGDAYGKALDQFTEALSNKGDMFEAWNGAGYVHLRLGAFNESIDDYNHTLVLQPELLEAIEHRAEAYMAVDRLEEAKAAYMNLFNHERPLADQLMAAMQQWVVNHHAAANGLRAADIDSFGKWLQEREGIAKQTAQAAASAPGANPP